MGKWRVLLTFIGLNADDEIEHASELVGHFHELHRVHVAREHDKAARSVGGERRLQRGAQLVQLDRVVRRPIVADREQAGGVERRTADDRVGVHDAQTGHHEHVAACGAGIEGPQQELLEGLRIAAVDRAERL